MRGGFGGISSLRMTYAEPPLFLFKRMYIQYRLVAGRTWQSRPGGNCPPKWSTWFSVLPRSTFQRLLSRKSLGRFESNLNSRSSFSIERWNKVDKSQMQPMMACERLRVKVGVTYRVWSEATYMPTKKWS